MSKLIHNVRAYATPIGEFSGIGASNAANCVFPRPTPVVMATKFGTKLAITRLA